MNRLGEQGPYIATIQFYIWACSSAGRAFGSHPRGRGFESLQVHHEKLRNFIFRSFFATFLSIWCGCEPSVSGLFWELLEMLTPSGSHLKTEYGKQKRLVSKLIPASFQFIKAGETPYEWRAYLGGSEMPRVNRKSWGIGMHRSTPRNIPVTRRSPTAARALCAAKDVLIRDTALSAGKAKIPVCGHG